MAKSKLEEQIALILRAAKLEFVREYRFHHTRRWLLDFAIVDHKIGVEVEGGTWIHGRHNTGAGFAKDCEKYNAATIEGWRILRYTTDMIRTSPRQILEDIQNAKEPNYELFSTVSD